MFRNENIGAMFIQFISLDGATGQFVSGVSVSQMY